MTPLDLSLLGQRVLVPFETATALIDGTAGPTPPAVSFAALLDGFANETPAASELGEKKDPPARGFTFDEFGMFGRHAAQAAAAGAIASKAGSIPESFESSMESSIAPSLEPSHESSIAHSMASDAQLIRQGTAQSGSFEPAIETESATAWEKAPGEAKSSLPAAPIFPSLQGESLPAEPFAPVKGSAPSAFKLPERRDLAPVSICIAGEADALMVLARIAGDSAGDLARLRQWVDEIAAGFGTRVKQLQVNGRSVPGGPRGWGRGRHGA